MSWQVADSQGSRVRHEGEEDEGIRGLEDYEGSRLRDEGEEDVSAHDAERVARFNGRTILTHM
jgi:hypothetical protein